MTKEERIINVKKIIKQIDEIDAATPWSIVEPKWWLEMSNARRSLHKSLDHLNKS